MTAPVSSKLSAIGYARARLLLVIVGLGVLGLIAGVLYVRRVDGVEVAATMLFMPILLALLFFRAKGGVLVAVLASLTYVLLRRPAIDAIGVDDFAGLIASRSIAYLVFGLVGGWANQTLELSLDKLDIYDQIDDDTGLFNARFFVQDSDLELARSKRYQTLFSITSVSFPTAAVEALGRRKAKAVLRELGGKVGESVRTVDRVVHAREGGDHHLVAVLPETGAEGAAVFGVRFADSIHEFLTSRGCQLPRDELRHVNLTLPGDDDQLQEIRRRFAAIDGMEHAHAVSA